LSSITSCPSKSVNSENRRQFKKVGGEIAPSCCVKITQLVWF
jgi:hypothetical protein